MFRRCVLIIGLVASSLEAGAAEGASSRWYTEQQAALGAPLYDRYCAACHGADGSATADWRTLDANGNYPPPPLNGSAHTWHHPLSVLVDTIEKGGAPFGGVMPAFGSVLTADERLAIVAYLQSWWWTRSMRVGKQSRNAAPNRARAFRDIAASRNTSWHHRLSFATPMRQFFDRRRAGGGN